MIHELSDVQSENIGKDTSSWRYCVVLPGAVIGKNCNICSHCFIENDERRREIAGVCQNGIANPLIAKPLLPDDPKNHVWHIYAVRVADRDGFRKHMEDMGVETLVHYPVPPHRQGAYPELAGLSLPITEAIHREVVSLPLNPVLTEAEIERVVEAANAWK